MQENATKECDDFLSFGKSPEVHEAYPHNVLEGFGNGCLLDLRVRMAADYLNGPMFANVVSDLIRAHAKGEASDETIDAFGSLMAAIALDTATALLDMGRNAGLVTPLPEGPELDALLRAQAARTARFQVLQQIEAQKAAQEEGSRLHSVVGH